MLCTDGGSLGAQRTKDDHDFLLLQERGSNGKRLRSKSVPSVCETVASPQTPCSFDTSLPAVEGWYRLYIYMALNEFKVFVIKKIKKMEM